MPYPSVLIQELWRSPKLHGQPLPLRDNKTIGETKSVLLCNVLLCHVVSAYVSACVPGACGPGSPVAKGNEMLRSSCLYSIELFLSAVPSPFLDVPSSSPTHPVMMGFYTNTSGR